MRNRRVVRYLIELIAIILLSQCLCYAQDRTRPKQPAIGVQVDAYLKQAAAFGFSGSALVAIDRKIVLHKGYGLADRKLRKAITPDTIFDIGSVTKQFTAAAIMKLEMQGKLKTDDLLSKYIDGVPQDKAEVTIHHLLTHTAGFPEYSGGDYAITERDETVKRILQEPLTDRPGTAMNYSNAGYSVLAAVVEKVSGQPYELFIREQFFKPVGMTHTGYVLPKFDRSTLPHGYNGEKDEGTALDHPWSPTGPYWNLLGNGGIMSTAGDMYKWLMALQGNEILTADLKKKLFTPFLNNYAYGWSVNKTLNGTLIGHSGSNDVGFCARVHWYVKKNTLIITMSNAGEYFGGMMYSAVVTNKISDLIFSGGFSGHRAPSFINVDSAALKKYEGTYKLRSGDRFIVSLADNVLTVEPLGQEAIDLLTLSPNASADGAATDITRKIVAGIVKRDFTELRANLATEDSFNRFRKFFEQRTTAWEASEGAYKDFEVLGTIPTWWSETQVPATIVRLNYEKGSHIFRLHWQNGKPIGLGGEAIKTPVTIPLKPVSSDAFYGWHLALTNGVSVRFAVVGEKVTGMTLTSKDGRKWTATRM